MRKCLLCGESIQENKTGRPAIFCTALCKTTFYRKGVSEQDRIVRQAGSTASFVVIHDPDGGYKARAEFPLGGFKDSMRRGHVNGIIVQHKGEIHQVVNGKLVLYENID